MVSPDNYAGSASLFHRACEVFPGGTTRITIPRDPHPIYMDRGEGAYLYDIDGNRYLDLVNNFTTLIHGHAFKPVCQAVINQINKGTCYASPTEFEVQLAELLKSRVQVIDKVRFVNTGTEAVMFAIKASRALTNRPAVAKLEGAYHGAYDWAEVSEGSAAEEWGDEKPRPVPYYRGMPQSVLDETLILPTNDIQSSRDILQANKDRLACVLIDVIPSRAGLCPINSDYLNFLREFTQQQEIVLISDEVLNFRLSFVGASERFGIQPDLLALGKIIGGGLPIGAVAGTADCMSVFEDLGDGPALPQGGTFSANPLSMVSGLASMSALDIKAFNALESSGNRLRRDLETIIKRQVVPFSISGQASLFRIHPTPVPPATYREAYRSPEQTDIMRRMSRFLLEQGVFMSSNGPGALSTVMSNDDIDKFSHCFSEFVRRMT